MKVNIPVRNAHEAMDLLGLVKGHGLVIEQDFTWAFIPNQYDGYDDSSHTQPLVEFVFRDSAMATFFQMKWAQ
jgi:hypothetical protein